jgi:putative cardiolipin synthase
LISSPRDAFNARYAFAAQARKTLDLQYYLWKSDLTGGLLMYQALLAADRGVQVRFLIDDIYHSGRDHIYAALDAHPSMQIRVFNPMGNRGAGKGANFLFHKSKLNHRMHNKIFLVDGAVAVLGGRNIGDDYFGIDPSLNFRDLDVLAVGPIALRAGEAFDTYWNSRYAVPIGALLRKPAEIDDLNALRERLDTGLSEELGAVPYDVPDTIDEIQHSLDELSTQLTWTTADVIVDPLERFEGDTESVFAAAGPDLAGATERELMIQTAYLIPAREGIAKMREMVARGVRVRIMTNSLMSNNHLTVHAHYSKYRKAMIEAGVELYELRADAGLVAHYEGLHQRAADSHAGLHTKAILVDGSTSIVGSYNMDPRSRIWNSEIGLVIRGEEFGATLQARMEEEFDSAYAYRVTLNEKGKLRWTRETAAGTEVHTHEPGASAWKRMLARFLSWLPIEKEL